MRSAVPYLRSSSSAARALQLPVRYVVTTAKHECTRLQSTRLWLDKVVIGQRLCPFAAPVRVEPQLKLRASSASDLSQVVQELAEEAAALQVGIDAAHSTDSTRATTLLVLENTIGGVALSWRDLITLSWDLQAALVNGGHAEHMQLVLFHPKATHNTYAEPGAPADAADYSIRAPHPTVQLLRERDILNGIQSYPDAQGIPTRNALRLRARGVEACDVTLRDCFVS